METAITPACLGGLALPAPPLPRLLPSRLARGLALVVGPLAVLFFSICADEGP